MRTDANMLVPVQLPPGIVRANTPYDTPGSWWDTNLVRWKSGTLLPIGGNQRITGTPLDSSVRKLHIFRDNSNSLFTLVGTTSKLWLSQSGFADITPSGLVSLSTIGFYGGYGTFGYGVGTYGTHRPQPSPFYSPYAYWTFANWGQDVILTNNADGRLFYYASSTPTTAPTVISTAPIGNGAVVTSSIVWETRGARTLFGRRGVPGDSRARGGDHAPVDVRNGHLDGDPPRRTRVPRAVGVVAGVRHRLRKHRDQRPGGVVRVDQHRSGDGLQHDELLENTQFVPVVSLATDIFSLNWRLKSTQSLCYFLHKCIQIG